MRPPQRPSVPATRIPDAKIHFSFPFPKNLLLPETKKHPAKQESGADLPYGDRTRHLTNRRESAGYSSSKISRILIAASVTGVPGPKIAAAPFW